MQLKSWIYGFGRCDYCLCTCVDDLESENTVKFISLMTQTSDISNNKVVTGIRFTKVGNMLHLQIEESSLLPNGDTTNATWKQKDEIRVAKNGWFFKKVNSREFSLDEDVDYASLIEESKVDLDDVVVPSSHVVTGVQIKKNDFGSLYLQIRVTNINFQSGTLKNLSESRWISAKQPNHGDFKFLRNEINIISANNPTKIRNHTLQSTGHDSIRFQMTDFELDLSRSTVPFIDGLEVTTINKFPLSGVGLYYKGHEKSGGYIAPRIFTYDIYSHFKKRNNIN